MTDERISDQPLNDCRFVVLRHDVGSIENKKRDRHGPVHFDWMFQIDDSLRTWSTMPMAHFDQTIQCDAKELPNHRLAYLTIEGDIGGDRGSVKRVAQGQIRQPRISPDRYEACLLWNHTDLLTGSELPDAPPIHSPPIHSPPIHSPPIHSPPIHSPPIDTTPIRRRVVIQRITDDSWRLRLELGL